MQPISMVAKIDEERYKKEQKIVYRRVLQGLLLRKYDVDGAKEIILALGFKLDEQILEEIYRQGIR